MKIVVAYWHGQIEGLKYTHNEEFEYSDEKRTEIIDYFLVRGYSVMLRPLERFLIWVDKGRFGQR